MTDAASNSIQRPTIEARLADMPQLIEEQKAQSAQAQTTKKTMGLIFGFFFVALGGSGGYLLATCGGPASVALFATGTALSGLIVPLAVVTVLVVVRSSRAEKEAEEEREALETERGPLQMKSLALSGTSQKVELEDEVNLDEWHLSESEAETESAQDEEQLPDWELLVGQAQERRQALIRGEEGIAAIIALIPQLNAEELAAVVAREAVPAELHAALTEHPAFIDILKGEQQLQIFNKIVIPQPLARTLLESMIPAEGATNGTLRVIADLLRALEEGTPIEKENRETLIKAMCQEDDARAQAFAGVLVIIAVRKEQDDIKMKSLYRQLKPNARSAFERLLQKTDDHPALTGRGEYRASTRERLSNLLKRLRPGAMCPRKGAVPTASSSSSPVEDREARRARLRAQRDGV